MASVVIGHLSLKVTPDTTGFREKAKSQADAIEKSMDPITVPIEVDGRKAVSDAKATEDQLQKTFRRIKAGVTLDTKKALSEASLARKKIEKSISGVKIRAELANTMHMVPLLRSAIRKTELSVGAITVPTRVDSSKLTSEYMAGVARMKAAAKAAELEVRLKAKADLKSVVREVQKMRATAMQKMGTLGIKFDPIKDPFSAIAKSTGLRMLWKLHQEKFQAISNFDMLATKVGTLTIAFSSLGASILSTTGNLLSWGRDLASIGALILPMPGVVAGLGLQFLILQRVMQDAGTYLPNVSKQWQELEAAMSENFWAKAQKPIQHMIDTLFPAFSKGIKQVSTDLGVLVGNLAKGFATNMADKLPGMMLNLSKATQIAAKGMDDLAKGLSTLLEFGMSKLPALANEFNKLTASFAEWITINDKNGNLDAWVDRAVLNFKSLLSVVGSLGSVLGGLGKAAAAAGGSTLESLAQTMKGAAEVVQSGPFQAALTSFMQDIYAFTNQVGGAISQAIQLVATEFAPMFGNAMKNMAPAMSAIITNLFAGLTNPQSIANFESMFAGLTQGLATLAPVMDLLGGKISIVFDLIGSAFANLMPVVTSFISEFSTILDAVHQPLKDLFDTLGNATAGNLEAMGPGIQLIADAMASLLTSLQPVADAWGSMKQVIEPAMIIFGNIAKTLAAFLAPVLGAIGAMLPMMAEAWGSVLSAVAPLTQYLPLIGKVLGVVAGIIITVLMSALSGIANGISNIIEGVMNVFNGLITFITGVFTGNWSQAWEGIKQVALGLWQTILGAFQVWINIGLFGLLKGGLFKILGLWKTGWSAVKTFGTNLWNGIKSFFTTSFVQGMQTAWSTGLNVIKTVWNFIWNGIKSFGETVFKAIKTGVTDLVKAIGDGASKFLSSVKKMLDDAVSAITGKVEDFVRGGIALVEGVIRGIKSKAGEVVSAVSDMASSAWQSFQDALSINSPSRVFRDIAHSIPEGVAVGIAQKTHMAVSAAEAMAQAVADVPMELNDVVAPDMGNFTAGAYSAMVDSYGGAGSDVSINQTFNESNVDAEDVARELHFTMRRLSMSGQVW